MLGVDEPTHVGHVAIRREPVCRRSCTYARGDEYDERKALVDEVT
jgi:hypothetical protein